MNPDIRTRRVYDPAAPDDGTRVLADRVWPRGLSKEAAALDEWCKEAAPSTELRRWYGHDPERYGEFARRYGAELTEPERQEALDRLRERARGGRLTLLTATKDLDLAHVGILAEAVREGRAGS